MPRSLSRALLLSSRLTLLLNIMLAVNCLREHSIPLSKSLITILNRTGTNTEPWGTPLYTGAGEQGEAEAVPDMNDKLIKPSFLISQSPVPLEGRR